jgi:diguanylate cyclase
LATRPAEVRAEREQARRRSRTRALGLPDVDDFERLDDKLGHGADGVALRRLAARVRGLLRPSDLVGALRRRGFRRHAAGDRAGGSAARALSHAARDDRGAVPAPGRAVFITFSAGVTLHRPGKRPEEALDRADEARYQAKRRGKSRTCLA